MSLALENAPAPVDPLDQQATAEAIGEQFDPTTVEELGETAVKANERASEQLPGIDHEAREKALQERVTQAKLSCEFDYSKSPEIGEALEGFYHDHYELADMIEAAIDGGVSEEDLERVMGEDRGTVPDEVIEKSLQRLDDGRQAELPSVQDMSKLLASAIEAEKAAGDDGGVARERTIKAAMSALYGLFAESSIGVTTVEQSEIDTLKALTEKVAEAAKETGKVKEKGNGSIEWPSDKPGDVTRRVYLSNSEIMSHRIQEAQKVFWDDTRHAGQLEYHNTGQIGQILATPGGLMPRTEQFRRKGEMRAQTANGDQMHSVVPHFTEVFDPALYKNGEQTGTMATPLWKVIQSAPFGRDAEYATVRVMDDEALDKVPKIVEVGSIGSGDDDRAGDVGRDRVFFASAGQEDGEQPDSYNIDSDGDTGFIFIFDGKSPHAGIRGERAGSMTIGVGENFPDRVVVDVDAGQTVEERVGAYQEQQFAKQWGRVVVPLRRGVFKFRPENMPTREVRGRPAPNYNANPTMEQAA